LGTVLLSSMVERHYSRSLRVSWKMILFVWEILLFFALMCQLADRLLPVTLTDLEQRYDNQLLVDQLIPPLLLSYSCILLTKPLCCFSVGHMADWASHALKKMDKFFLKFKARHPILYVVLFLFLLALWPFAWVWWLIVFTGKQYDIRNRYTINHSTSVIIGLSLTIPIHIYLSITSTSPFISPFNRNEADSFDDRVLLGHSHLPRSSRLLVGDLFDQKAVFLCPSRLFGPALGLRPLH